MVVIIKQVIIAFGFLIRLLSTYKNFNPIKQNSISNTLSTLDFNVNLWLCWEHTIVGRGYGSQGFVIFV